MKKKYIKPSIRKMECPMMSLVSTSGLGYAGGDNGEGTGDSKQRYGSATDEHSSGFYSSYEVDW